MTEDKLETKMDDSPETEQADKDTRDQETTEADRIKRAFLAHMRHELRTPINAIIGYGEMLLEDAEDAGEEEFMSDLEKIHEAGTRLLELVNDILDPAKIEAGDITLDLETFGANMRHELRTPLNAVIGYSEMLQEDAEDEGKEEFMSDLEKIHAAGTRLLELIDDIINFSTIGSGESELNLETFDISSQIKDMVASIRPLVAGDTEKVGDGYLLVVDDNEINRNLLSRRLARQGHTITTAVNGRQALEMIGAENFDVVLLDIMMPEMNGYQVLEYLKRDSTLRHIPVIMMSALDEMDSVVRCIEMGAEDYLPKPFDPVLLRSRVGACLEKKRFHDREVSYLQQIEEEKKRSDELLRVILPGEIVEELKETDSVKPRRCENVAVLFTDIVGFTPYCDAHPPEDVLSQLQKIV